MNVPLHEHQYLLEPRAPQCRVMSGWRAAVVLALVYQLGCRVTCDTDAETPSQRLAQWRALRNAAAPSQRSSHSSHAAAASQQGTECELEDGEGSRKGASTRLKEWRSQRRGGEHREEGPNKHNQEGSKEADNAHLPLGETIAILLVGWTRLVTSAVSLGTLQEHVCSPVCML